jgi:hypothetical protein
MAAHAEREGGMAAALVEAPRNLPDAIASLGLDAEVAGSHLGLPPDAGDGVEVGRDASAWEE